MPKLQMELKLAMTLDLMRRKASATSNADLIVTSTTVEVAVATRMAVRGMRSALLVETRAKMPPAFAFRTLDGTQPHAGLAKVGVDGGQQKIGSGMPQHLVQQGAAALIATVPCGLMEESGKRNK
jgi:hypothetical protein